MLQQFTESTTLGFRVLVVATVVVTVGILGLADGNLALALVPTLAAIGAVAIWRLPMRYIAHVVLFLALLIDNPTERPGRGLYKSPLLVLGNFLYEALSKSAHIPGLKFTGLELLFFALAAIVGLRMLARDEVDGEHRLQAAPPLLKACVVSMGALVGLEVYGILRGGSVPHSLLQMRTMFFMPFLTMFFAYAFKSRRDINTLLLTFMTVAVLRALMCIYYYFTVIRKDVQDGGQSGDGSYVTTHSDSILAAVAIVICIATIYQHPTLRAKIVAAFVVPVVGLGVMLNNRRIAFVAVALGLLFSYMVANRWFRRRIQRTILTMLPVMIVYIIAGWNAGGGWAKPVQSLKSVIVQRDTSSATRDIENFNLLQTLKQHPVSGSGFGHEYIEAVKAFDISKVFEAYRYVPHNSILWFWGAGGVIGYTAYWMFLVVGVFFAARLARFAESNRQSVMAMTAVSAVVAYGSQCFGDMGLMSWMGCLIVSACLGICGSMASLVGGWDLHPPGPFEVEEVGPVSPGPAFTGGSGAARTTGVV